MHSPVDQIKERLSIEDVVSSYISLERAGSNLKARCPFHNEKTPSFFISPERNSFYCFGCGAKGDIFTFVQEFEGLDFKGALKLLAEKAQVSLGVYDQREASEKEKIFRIMEEATLFFELKLKDKQDALTYLKERGLEESSIKNFRIGFAPAEWQALYDYLKGRSWTEDDIERAGLGKRSEKDGKQSFYDRFRGRIMFPISDSSGRVIAFSGRLFVDDGKSAKYLNSPETPIFSKSSVLYGLDKAKDSIRKNNFSILVEGQMDLVLAHQAGFRNTVATSGTALADTTLSKDNVVSNLGLLRRLSGNIALAFDGDQAGAKASMRAGKIALSLGMDVKVVPIQEGMDPADLILKEGKDAWREAIRNSKHLIESLLNQILNNHKDDILKSGKEIREKVLPFVGALSSSIDQSHFVSLISRSAGIPENALNEDLKKIEKESKAEKEEIKEVEKGRTDLFRKNYIERRLMGVFFWQKIKEESKINPEELLNRLAGLVSLTTTDIEEKWNKEKEDLIFEAEVFYSGNVNFEKDIDELIENFEEEILKEKLFQKMQDLRKYEIENNQEGSREILKEINEINKKIQDIKSRRLNK